jgi:glycosyltransferase involved in cell wall biosynthesis
MRSMKIVFLFPHFLSPGGAANVVLQFAKSMQSKKHQVEICCAKVSQEFRNNHPEIKFKELKIPASNSIAYWLFFPYWQTRINRQLENYNNCILFAHVLPSNWWAWIYKRKRKQAMIVWYCHEPSAFIHSTTWINSIPVDVMKWGARLLNPILKRIDISLEKENDVVICNSNFTALQYQTVYGKKADGVIYPPLTVKTSHESNKENYILTVGRLSRFKNVDTLIKAFNKLKKELSEATLVIVGEGEIKKELERLAADLKLENRISFKGRINDKELAQLYQKARVTVICSKDEPFGLVPIESMMYGTPVIAHNSGGPQETIQHSRTGFLYNVETELTRYIKQIFEAHSSEYFQLQQNCLKEVAQYDVSNSMPKLESIFQKLVNEKPSN